MPSPMMMEVSTATYSKMPMGKQYSASGRLMYPNQARYAGLERRRMLIAASRILKDINVPTIPMAATGPSQFLHRR